MTLSGHYEARDLCSLCEAWEGDQDGEQQQAMYALRSFT